MLPNNEFVPEMYDGANSKLPKGDVAFVNSNGLSFSITNATQMCASYTVPLAGAGITDISSANSDGTNASFARIDHFHKGVHLLADDGGNSLYGNIQLTNANGISFGTSAGNKISASHNALTVQTNQSVGLYGISNTIGQSSSSTVDARSVSVKGLGIVSVGMSAGSLLISAAAAAGDPPGSGITDVNSANSDGTAASYARVDHFHKGIHLLADNGGNSLYGDVQLTNANGISFGTSAGNKISASHNALTVQTNQSGGIYAISQTVGQSSSSTFDARTLSINADGIISVGWSNGSLRLSATTAQSNQSGGIYALSQTVGQSSSSTFDARTLSINAAGIISVGWSNGSLRLSATTAQSNQSGGIYVLSQTTGDSSSSTFDARTLSINADGIISGGWSNGSLRLSATQSGQAFSAQGGSSAFQTLTFTNSNGFSFSNTNGSIWGSHNGVTNAITQISASGGSVSNGNLTFTSSNRFTFGMNASVMTASHELPQIGFFENVPGMAMTVGIQNLSRQTWSFAHFYLPAYLYPGNFYTPVQISSTTATSVSAVKSFTFSAAIYTKTGSTLNILNSCSGSLTGASNVNRSNVWVSAGTWSKTDFLTPGNYYMGYALDCAGTSQSAFLLVCGGWAPNFTNSQQGPIIRMGQWGTSSASPPSAISISDLAQSGVRNVIPYFMIDGYQIGASSAGGTRAGEGQFGF